MTPDQWRTRVKQTAPDQQRTCEKQTAPDQQSAQFSAEEIVKFKKQMEEHFDITLDERYNLWLSLQAKPQPQPAHTFLSKIISSQPPITKKPTIGPKSIARVVTSSECCQEINVKKGKIWKL